MLSAISHSAKRVGVRYLNIHEYQSKELLRKFKVATQRGGPATSREEAEKIVKELPKDVHEIVVKAQVHTGGRGKGTFKNGFKSGVHFCKTPAEAGELTTKMVGQVLVTHQTGADGIPCNKVFVGESVPIAKEMYFAILLDRAHQGPVMVASPDGGMDIETVAEKTPERIYTEPVDLKTGPRPEQLKRLAESLKFTNPASAAEQMNNLYNLFSATDCTLLEINPLAETPSGAVLAADAKLLFDDNAKFRQPEIFNYRDTSQEDAREVEAGKYDLNYIGLDGSIGCMVNGAGLAMATMDIIKLHGGSPANFLDVGGGANTAQVTEAFKILQNDSSVKAILVNIFGGIMQCDTIANGIVTAAKQVNLRVPLVVRLEGTNVEQGKAIIANSKLPIVTADDLDDAAKKAVAAIQ